MPELLKLIWDICCLRRGPQDLPFAPALLLVLCVVTLGWEVALDSDPSTFGYGVAGLIVNFGVLLAILHARGLRSRFVQTATAFIACALVFELLILPLSLLFGDPKSTQMSTGRGLIVFAILMLMAWRLIVDANIFRHSLNVPFLAGIFIAVTWFVVELYLLQVFAHVAPAA